MARSLPVLAFAALSACGYQLEGPAPIATDVAPALVCNDQLDTTVTVSGDALTPLATDVLTGDPQLVLPELTIIHASTLDGASGTGAVVDLASAVRWIDDDTMAFDALSALAIPPGVYDLYVLNPDGQHAEIAAAIAVTPPPILSAMSPEILCVDQSDQQVTLTGEHFVVVGDALPTVTVSGVELTPDAAEGCYDLAGPVAGRVCTTLQVTIPQGALEAGVHAATVTNPDTAPCASTEEVLFEVVPAPVLADIEPEPSCIDQGDRGFVATGENFLVLADGTMPEITFGVTLITPDAASECTELTGPAGGELCQELTFTLPMQAEEPGVHQASLQCPAPADCSTDLVDVELVPEPTLELVAADLVCLEQGDQELVLTGTGFVVLADGTLPMVALGEAYVAQADAAEDCEPLAGPNGGETCATLRLTVPEDGLSPDVFDVVVTNPYPADCATPASIPLEVVPRPTLSAAEPLLTCVDQGDSEVLLTGESFLVLADGTAPTVEIGGYSVAATLATGCVPLAGPAGGELCTGLTAVVTQGALDAGVHDVFVTNPQTAACVTEEPVQVETAAAPTLASIDTPLTCGGLDETFTLTGEGFLVVGGVLPTVRLGAHEVAADSASGCTSLEGPVTGERCTSLSLTVPADTLEIGLLDVAVQNPPTASCATEEPVSLEVTGAPSVSAVHPGEICTEAGDVVIVVEGDNFISIGDDAPTVRIGGDTYVGTSPLGCSPLAGPISGERCLAFEIAIPAGTYTAIADLPVEIVNPSPVACALPPGTVLAVGPPPVVNAASPSLTCSGQDLTITGSGFVPSSAVTVGGAAAEITYIDGNTLLAEIPEGLALGVSHDVTLTNPGECEASLASAVSLLEAPRLDSVAQELVCGEQGDSVFTLTGATFLDSGSEKPTVHFGSVELPVDALSGCSDLGGGAQSCTQATVTVPAGTLAPGLHDVSIDNPEPADCSSPQDVQIEVIAPPTLAEVVPPEQCWEVGPFSVTVAGGGFLSLDGALPTVTIGGETLPAVSADSCTPLTGPAGGELCDELVVDVPADLWDAAQTLSVLVSNPAPAACDSTESVDFTLYDPPRVTAVDPFKVCYGGLEVTVRGTGFRATPDVFFDGQPAQSVDFVSATELTVVIPEEMPPGYYDVAVVNPDTCDHTLDDGLLVVNPPIVFYVDPPSTYNGIPIQATYYVSGINDGVSDVWLTEQATGVATSLDFRWSTDDPNKVLAIIPNDPPFDEGLYDAYVLDDVGCEVSLDSAVHVEADLTITVTDVDAPFGWTNAYTPVEINGDGFVDVPRVYFSPVDPGSDTVATELSSVTWRSGKLLDAVVPVGLPVGLYDVLVVNPDGSVGLAEAGFEVTQDPPPVVVSASPATLPNNAAGTLTIQGSDFRDPSVAYACADPSTGAVTNYTGTVVSGSLASDGSSFKVGIPTSAISDGVCVITVTNGDDLTYGSYAAVTVTAPSQNLYPWKAGTKMTVPRRAPAAAAGRATRAARYLYAIGGDSGAASSAMSSIELANVGVYGALGQWSALPDGLPAPRTLAGVASVDRFVYVVGGHDGGGPVNTVLRAQVLDPLETPKISEIQMTYASGAGVEAGTWIYRIAALYPADYETNPSGESLAGDPFVLRVPDIAQALQIELKWTPVADASGYRVYRSPTADAGSNAEVQLIDLPNVTTWTDDGSAAPDTSVVPLPKGAFGEWATLPPLGQALEAPCVATATDPADPSIEYLYVAGGRGPGGIVNGVSFLPITRDSDQVQSVGAWTSAGVTLADPVHQCGAWAVDAELHSVVAATESWIYVGGGLKANGQTVSTVQTGRVQAGGALASWAAVAKDLKPSRAGFGVASASDFLYAFGGQGGTPHAGGNSTRIAGPPALDGWNNLGTSMAEARYLPGSAQQSSVIFIVGGQSGTAPATDTVDYTNY